MIKHAPKISDTSTNIISNRDSNDDILRHLITLTDIVKGLADHTNTLLRFQQDISLNVAALSVRLDEFLGKERKANYKELPIPKFWVDDLKDEKGYVDYLVKNRFMHYTYFYFFLSPTKVREIMNGYIPLHSDKWLRLIVSAVQSFLAQAPSLQHIQTVTAPIFRLVMVDTKEIVDRVKTFDSEVMLTRMEYILNMYGYTTQQLEEDVNVKRKDQSL